MTQPRAKKQPHISAFNYKGWGNCEISVFISETERDMTIVTIERQYEVICAVSHGDISNDLDGPLTRFSRSRHF